MKICSSNKKKDDIFKLIILSKLVYDVLMSMDITSLNLITNSTN
jgi:hypothetical protein